MLAIGVLLAIVYILVVSKKQGLDPRLINDLLFYTLLSGIIGGKLFLLITNLKYYLAFPAEWKYLLISGGSFHGGLLGGLAFFLFYVRKKKLSLPKIGDIMTPAIALAHFFGRMGCFFAGCCYGRDAHGACAVTFHSERAHELTGVPLGHPVYPTQLMEALLNLLNFALLFFIYRRRKFDGLVFALYFLNYGVIRFAMEFFRGDPDRGYIFGNPVHPFSSLSVPQLVSLGLIALGIMLFANYRRNARKD
jgi:phosphatidylglycerol:prolipoprotein diacylglycerol transferase